MSDIHVHCVFLAGMWPSLANGALCLSTPKYNCKSGTASKPLLLLKKNNCCLLIATSSQPYKTLHPLNTTPIISGRTFDENFIPVKLGISSLALHAKSSIFTAILDIHVYIYRNTMGKFPTAVLSQLLVKQEIQRTSDFILYFPKHLVTNAVGANCFIGIK